MSAILTLLNQIREDKIVLPAIQRGFVWPPDRIVSLLDSILRGYPTGIVLLWETYHDIQYRSFAKEYWEEQHLTYSDNGDGRQLRLVLDGQQRLQSLYIALYGTYGGRALYFDLLSGRTDGMDLAELRYAFRFMKPDEVTASNTSPHSAVSQSQVSGPEHWVSVADIFSMAPQQRLDYAKGLASDHDLPDADSDRVHLNLSRLETSLTMDENVLRVATIDDNLPPASPYRKTEADVLEIFVRINRLGTPLTRSDLIFSMLKLNWRESAEALPAFLDRINDGNSFELDTDFVIRALFAVSNLGTKLDLDLLRRTDRVAALQANFTGCCAAIASAVDFVSQRCHCQSSSVLGSPYFLLPLVYYLFHAPNHDVPHSEVAKVRKALYILGLARPFSRYGEGRTGAFIRDELRPRLDAKDYSYPLNETLAWTRYWERLRSMDDLINTNVALTLHIVQGLTGAKVQYHRNSPETDHIFPRAKLRQKGWDADDVNTVGNYWILAQGKNRNKSDTDPSKYFSDVPDEELELACIDRDLLQYSRYRRFLRRRSELLIERIVAKVHLTEEDLATLLQPINKIDEDV